MGRDLPKKLSFSSEDHNTLSWRLWNQQFFDFLLVYQKKYNSGEIRFLKYSNGIDYRRPILCQC